MVALKKFPIVVEKNVSEKEFVDYWSKMYEDPREDLYLKNIHKRLTRKRLLELFEWKNGGPISESKCASIQHNYIDKKPVAPDLQDRKSNIEFISKPGGAIWRIFWLHCHNSETYPIFDQHVFRAMIYIKYDAIREIPVANTKRAEMYFDEYLPFYRSFGTQHGKRLDEALWSFGKYLRYTKVNMELR